MSKQEDILESQIREIYGRVVYTHKTHEKCADILKRRNNYIKCFDIMLTVLTTTSVLFVFFKDNYSYRIIAAMLSALLLGLNLYSYNFNLLAIIEKHKQAALDILEVREKLLSLLIDIRIGNKEINQLQEIRDNLNEQLVNTYRGAPKTINKAYQIASKALQQNEEFTFSDTEIDKFLPENIRHHD